MESFLDTPLLSVCVLSGTFWKKLVHHHFLHTVHIFIPHSLYLYSLTLFPGRYESVKKLVSHHFFELYVDLYHIHSLSIVALYFGCC